MSFINTSWISNAMNPPICYDYKPIHQRCLTAVLLAFESESLNCLGSLNLWMQNLFHCACCTFHSKIARIKIYFTTVRPVKWAIFCRQHFQMLYVQRTFFVLFSLNFTCLFVRVLLIIVHQGNIAPTKRSRSYLEPFGTYLMRSGACNGDHILPYTEEGPCQVWKYFKYMSRVVTQKRDSHSSNSYRLQQLFITYTITLQVLITAN